MHEFGQSAIDLQSASSFTVTVTGTSTCFVSDAAGAMPSRRGIRLPARRRAWTHDDVCIGPSADRAARVDVDAFSQTSSLSHSPLTKSIPVLHRRHPLRGYNGAPSSIIRRLIYTSRCRCSRDRFEPPADRGDRPPTATTPCDRGFGHGGEVAPRRPVEHLVNGDRDTVQVPPAVA